MSIDLRLLTCAIHHHAEELHRLLDVKCEHTGTSPQHSRVLLVALFDYLNAEGQNGKQPYRRAAGGVTEVMVRPS